MIQFRLFLAVALAIGIKASSIRERLVGAKDAEIGEFPFAVSIRSNNKHFCSGALITKRHVLTAAHCVFVTNYMFGSLNAVVGTNSVSTGGKSYRISHSYQHPDFEFQDLFPDWMYDIGIFKLSDEVELSNLIGIAELPTKDVDIGSRAVVSGWGSTKDVDTPVWPTLQKLEMEIIDQKTCQEKMEKQAYVDQSHICAKLDKGYGTCAGDSGGPLIQDGVLIGIVSGGIPCAKGYPDVYTNVFKYLSYINEIVNKSK